MQKPVVSCQILGLRLAVCDLKYLPRDSPCTRVESY